MTGQHGCGLCVRVKQIKTHSLHCTQQQRTQVSVHLAECFPQHASCVAVQYLAWACALSRPCPVFPCLVSPIWLSRYHSYGLTRIKCCVTIKTKRTIVKKSLLLWSWSRKRINGGKWSTWLKMKKNKVEGHQIAFNGHFTSEIYSILYQQKQCFFGIFLICFYL